MEDLILTFFYMTMRLVGELFLCTLIWGLIIFLFITVICFLSFWKDLFSDLLERKKEWALKYQTVESYFMLRGKELEVEEIASLEQRAKDLSTERNMLIKDEDCFHESVLYSVYQEWLDKTC